jgi:hypothetical protein
MCVVKSWATHGGGPMDPQLHITSFLKNAWCSLQSMRPNGSTVEISIADPNPDPPKPYVFRPPGSGSGTVSQRYGSGSFYHEAKIVSKTLIPTVL